MVKKKGSRSGVARVRRTVKPAVPRDLDTEQRILTAARQEFIDRGLAGARMQAIADRAGVNKALLHYYYRSKTNLYDTVMKGIIGGLWSAVRSEINKRSEPMDLRQFIRAFVETFVGLMAPNPDFIRMFLREILDGGGNIPRLFGELFSTISDVPLRMVGSYVAEMKKGAAYPMSPVHLMVNLAGMSAATFVFRQLVESLPAEATGMRIVFDEGFYKQRIDSIVRMACDGIFIKGPKS